MDRKRNACRTHKEIIFLEVDSRLDYKYCYEKRVSTADAFFNSVGANILWGQIFSGGAQIYSR